MHLSGQETLHGRQRGGAGRRRLGILGRESQTQSLRKGLRRLRALQGSGREGGGGRPAGRRVPTSSHLGPGPRGPRSSPAPTPRASTRRWGPHRAHPSSGFRCSGSAPRSAPLEPSTRGWSPPPMNLLPGSLPRAPGHSPGSGAGPAWRRALRPRAAGLWCRPRGRRRAVNETVVQRPRPRPTCSARRGSAPAAASSRPGAAPCGAAGCSGPAARGTTVRGRGCRGPLLPGSSPARSVGAPR